jgi:hypothetical protein
MPVPYRIIAERHLTDRLMQANAVWPGSGQPLETRSGGEQRALQRLVAAGVVREEGAGHFYLYVPAYATRLTQRRWRMAIAIIVVFAMAGIVTALARIKP